MLFDGMSVGYIGNALVPVADAYAGAVTTEVYNMEHFHAGAFVIAQGAIEDSGASNIVTLLACDNATPSTTSTMVFRSRAWVNSTDVWGALTSRTATGVNFNNAVAVADGIYTVEFTADEVYADGNNGYTYVQLAIAETVNKTVTACVLFLGLNPRYPAAIPPTAET
jgi:hypothetical protein